MLIVAVFLDDIDRDRASRFREKREPFCKTFLATFRLLRDRRLLLVVPLTMYSGFEQSFLSGEYTKVGTLTWCQCSGSGGGAVLQGSNRVRLSVKVGFIKWKKEE